MKKYSTHFFSFLLVFTVFLISGCSSDSDDNTDPLQKIMNDPTPRIRFDYYDLDDNITTYAEKLKTADQLSIFYSEEYKSYQVWINWLYFSNGIELLIRFNQNNGEKVTVGVKDVTRNGLLFDDPANARMWGAFTHIEVLKVQEPTDNANGKIWIIGKNPGDSDDEIPFVYVNEFKYEERNS